MEAKFASTCSVCGQQINVGDQQTRHDDGGWRHEVCPSASFDDHEPGTDQPGHEPVHQPPSLPAGATADDLRRWLREVEAQELAAKRAAEAQARAANRDKHLEKVRPARSKLVEELFAYHGIAPIERDRNESQRLAALRAKAMGDGTMMQRPEWFDITVAERIQFAPKAKQSVHEGDAAVH